MEYLVRFLAGGILVSAFAVLGDVLRPKSLAGLFGAAPSVALATLTLALWKEGGDYVSIEGHSMIPGALALAAYGLLVCQLPCARDGPRWPRRQPPFSCGWLWLWDPSSCSWVNR
jgi:hypothetical protein